MEKLLEWLEFVEDSRQQAKVKHPLKDIIVLVLFASLAKADDFFDIELFGHQHEEFLRNYIPLEHGIPSHDTINRVMGLISPEILQQLHNKWFEMLNADEGEKLKKIIAIDGKTMRGNKQNDSKPSHIVSAWNREGGFCLGQKEVGEKSNEITAIPDLLDKIQIKGHVITIDAMGTQKEIVEKIKSKRADYVLALKGNQGNLFQDVKDYFEDDDFLAQIKESENYKVTKEKARSQVEVREYFQTDDIKWLPSKKDWKGLKSVAMERKTIVKNEEKTVIYRFFISSLVPDIELLSRAVRGHWSVESMHWHLDVTFKEDGNLTVDKQAAQNHNIIRKLCLSILKTIDVAGNGKKMSIKSKRFLISLDSVKYLKMIVDF